MANLFITGVSSGIGHALAARYLATGDSVYGVSRRAPQDLLAEDRFRFRPVDLGDHARTARQLPALFAGVTRIDLVVLNAGILGRIQDMANANLPELETLMNVNVWANKTVLDTLFAAGIEVGQVVAISSGAAVNGHRGWSGYSISKAALNMLVQLYAAERPDVHFCALAPGLIDTAMQDYLCGLEADPRFDSVDYLKANRNTEAMPRPQEAAIRLQEVMATLPDTVATGGFKDVRDA